VKTFRREIYEDGNRYWGGSSQGRGWRERELRNHKKKKKKVAQGKTAF